MSLRGLFDLLELGSSAITFLWRGPCREEDRGWHKAGIAERPEEMATIRLYRGGYVTIRRRDGTTELHKLPGAPGKTALERGVEGVKTELDRVLERLFGSG